MASQVLTGAPALEEQAESWRHTPGVKTGRSCRSRPARAANDVIEASLLFDGPERLAILIGMRDRATLLDPAGGPARLIALLFGVRGPQPLADPRLEALRRLAVALRNRPRRLSAAVDTALAVGVPRTKVDLLLVQLRLRLTPSYQRAGSTSDADPGAIPSAG